MICVHGEVLAKTAMKTATRRHLLMTHGIGAMIAVVLALVLMGIAGARKGPLEEVAGYVATTGTVASLEIHRRPTPSHTVPRQVFSDVKIAYRYRVAGKEYEGHRYRADERREKIGDAEKLRKTHGPGRSCEVWYDPSDPARSVLNRDAGSDTTRILEYLPPVAWGLLVLAVINGLLLGLRWSRS